MDKEKNYKYYFIITLAYIEKNLHKIYLQTNKKSLFGFVGKGKEDINLKPIFEAKLDDEFVALAFSCRISVKVKEFMISYNEKFPGTIGGYTFVTPPLNRLPTIP